MMTKSKMIQENSNEKEGYFPKTADGIFIEKDEAPKNVDVPNDGNPVPKKEGDENKDILTSPQVCLSFPHRVKND